MVMTEENKGHNLLTGDRNLPGIWLAMDTSTIAMTIAVFKNGQLIGEGGSIAERNHSALLNPAIKQLLSSIGLTIRDLNGVAVGQGPGSYTGIRIGVTVAKTFAWSLRIPLIAISSLEALAYGWIGHASTSIGIVPLMDARRGRAYTALYSKKNGVMWHCAAPDGIRSMSQWLDELKAIGEFDSLIFVGDVGGYLPLINTFREQWDGKVETNQEPLRASSIGELAAINGLTKVIKDVHAFMPNYTQLSEPERNYSNRLN